MLVKAPPVDETRGVSIRGRDNARAGQGTEDDRRLRPMETHREPDPSPTKREDE